MSRWATLTWNEAKAGRTVGQVERWDLATDASSPGQWSDAGWCDIAEDAPLPELHPIAPFTEDREIKAPMENRVVAPKPRRTMEKE